MLKATKASAIYTSDAITQGVGEMDWADYTLTVKTSPKEMTVLAGGSVTSLKTVDLVTAGEELVVYDGANVKSGAVGTVSATVGDNTPQTKKAFASTYVANKSTVTLQNGNVFIAYRDITNDGRGTFVIYDGLGNLVKSATTFTNTDTSVSYVSTTLLQNGNVFVAFNTGTGNFMIFDQAGNVVKSMTSFLASGAPYTDCITLPNGNVMITYIEDSMGYPSFIVYSQSGVLVTTNTAIISTQSTYGSSSLLLNGNIAYVRKQVATAYGKLDIFSQSGTMILANIAFSGASTIDYPPTVATLLNGNIFIAYTDQSNNNYGTFVIYDQSGNVVKSPAVFAGSNTAINLNINILSNGNVMISYSNGSIGTFVIYDQDGVVVKSPTIFNNAFTAQISSCLLLDGNTLVAYTDVNVSNYGTFNIIKTGTTYTSDITPLALTQAPTKAWKKSNLPATYTSFEGLGRTLLADKSVTIDSATTTQVVFKDTIPGIVKTGDELGVKVVTTQGNNLPGTASIYSSSATAHQSCATLTNGNIIVAYQDSGNSNYGTFNIYNAAGGVVKAKTVFSGTYCSYVKVAALPNGNAVIHCVANTSTSAFIILDASGNVVKALTNDAIVANSYTSLSVFKNGDFVVAGYRAGASGWCAVYNQSGTQVGSAFSISNTVSSVSCLALDNDTIFFAWADVSNYLTVRNYTKSGTAISSLTILDSANTADSITSKQLQNGNILVSYVVGSLSTFLICSSAGVIVKSKVQQASSTYNPCASILSNGNFVFAYSTSTTVGSYKIYDQLGALIFAGGSFSATQTSYISLTTKLNGDTFVSYVNVGNSSYGTFNIINTEYITTDYTPVTSNVVEVAVVGDNLPVGEVEINAAYSVTSVSSCKLSNGNVIHVYGTGSLGRFKIYNQAGTVIKTDTNFSAADSSVITVSQKGGNIFISYIDVSSGGGRLTILDIDGNIITNSVAVGSSINAITCKALSNGNVMVMYYDGAGRYTIYGPTGSVVASSAVFYNVAGIPLKITSEYSGDNIVLLYSDDVNYFYAIIASTGAIVKASTQISASSASGTLNLLNLADRRILFLYTNWSTSKTLFMITDASGTIVKSETILFNYVISAGSFTAFGPRVSLMPDGNIFIFYTNPTGTIVSYKIFNELGVDVVSEKSISSLNGTGAIFTNVIQLDNYNMLISYRNSSTTHIAYNIINTGNYSTYTCTIPAQVSAPLTAKIPSRATLNTASAYSYISSVLNIIYAKVTKAARELRFKHVAVNKDDTFTATSYALNKSV